MTSDSSSGCFMSSYILLSFTVNVSNYRSLQYFNVEPLRASNLYGEDRYRSFSVTDYGDRMDS